MKFKANAGESLVAERKLRGKAKGRFYTLTPAPSFPRATLMYDNKTIQSVSAQQTGADIYRAVLTVPPIEGDENVTLDLIWEVEEVEGVGGGQFYWEDTVEIDNAQRATELKEPVILNSDTEIIFQVPHSLASTETCSMVINDPTGTGAVPAIVGTIRSFSDRSNLIFPLTATQAAKMGSQLAILTYTDGPNTHRVASNYWVINPSMLSHANVLEGWLNKGRVNNVIPELRFETPDLLLYLSKGLDLLNSTGTTLTSFNGTNMTGILSHLWTLCSAWHMARAQYMAESMMAFDLNAQAVTLTVDRAQAWEALASDLWAQIESQVPQAKKLLGDSGVTGGSGNVVNARLNLAVGYTGLTLHPLTSLRNFYR